MEGRNVVIDPSGYQTDLAELFQHIDPESPIHSVYFDHIGKVGTTFLLENPSGAVVQHRYQQPYHLLVFDRWAIQGLEVAVVPLPPCAVEFLTQLGAGVALGAAAHDAQATTPDFDLGQTLGLALRAGLFTDFKIATSPRDPHENPCTD